MQQHMHQFTRKTSAVKVNAAFSTNRHRIDTVDISADESVTVAKILEKIAATLNFYCIKIK